MKQLDILFLGSESGTSQQRANALRRLGHAVTIIDPTRLVSRGKVLDKWIFETGGLFFEDHVSREVLKQLPARRFDLVFVDGGEMVGAKLARELKRRSGPVVNYNVDDPYSKRDKNKWRLYLQAVPLYDLVVVVRDCNVEEARQAGARDVLMVHRSADEVAHGRRALSEQETKKWSSEVAFIGTWMPERGPFFVELVNLGVPVTIYGDRWPKAKEWVTLERHWRGPAIYDTDYADAVMSAKVCLGMLSLGNRDQSTTRSFEIPLLGTAFCAKRTPEHLSLYREEEEAVFWDSAEECAGKCLWLLRDEASRVAIAERGHDRCVQNQTTNEKVLARIIERTLREEAMG